MLLLVFTAYCLFNFKPLSYEIVMKFLVRIALKMRSNQEQGKGNSSGNGKRPKRKK